MSSNILDRHQYDPKMITNIEVMAAYFVDLFYNHLYFEGKKLKVNGSVPSVTEGYKHALNAFIKSLGNARLYKKAVIGIHQYFMNYTSFTTISFAKCVDRLAANFVPLDYYSSLNNTQKMSVLRLVINQAVKEFTKKIVNDHLNKIIDHHQEFDNVRLLQDELIDCFLLEREGVYQRFVSSQTQTSSNETVNRLVAEKMQKEIKNLILEKIQLKKQNSALKQIIIKNNAENLNTTENIGNMEATISELKEEISLLKQHTTYSNEKEAQYEQSIEVSSTNINDAIIHAQATIESPRSDVEKSAFVSVDIEENDSDDDDNSLSSKHPHNTPNTPKQSPAHPNTPKQPPTPNNTHIKPIKSFPKKEINIATPVVPKKKRPSSNLGEGVALNDFY
jgi:hypothetical protein